MQLQRLQGLIHLINNILTNYGLRNVEARVVFLFGRAIAGEIWRLERHRPGSCIRRPCDIRGAYQRAGSEPSIVTTASCADRTRADFVV